MRRNRVWGIYWRLDKRFWLGLYLVVLLAVGWWSYGDLGEQVTGKVSDKLSRWVWEEIFAFAEWNEASLAEIFAASIPLWPDGELPAGELPVSGEPEEVSGDSVSAGVDFPLAELVTGVRLGVPESYLGKGIPLFAGYYRSGALLSREVAPKAPIPTEASTLPEQGAEKAVVPGSQPSGGTSGEQLPEKTEPGKAPAVFVYNTHTGENYAYPKGQVKVAGKRGGVVQVAAAIKKRLEEKYKLKVIQSDTIHDSDWLHSNPYGESLRTVQQQVKATPSVQVVMDVHRDATVPRANTVTKINGKQVARIMLVVGTNARNNNPDWMQNYRFAQQLGKELDKTYPGLLRKIETKRGRYNQHLHSNSILVEVGSTENTTEEAKAAGELLADVLAKMLAKAE